MGKWGSIRGSMEVYWEAGRNGSEKFVQLIGEHEHNVAPNMIIQNIKINVTTKWCRPIVIIK